jgi:arylsulfatase A-like enzyme
MDRAVLADQQSQGELGLARDEASDRREVNRHDHDVAGEVEHALIALTPFQRRLMEVAAGYAEHADVQAGRVLDEIEALGLAENTTERAAPTPPGAVAA